MDTVNNNQPISNQTQTPQQPQNQAVNMEQQTTQYQNPEMLKGKSGRTVILLVVLLIIVIGIAAYLVFVNTMANKPQNAPAATSVLPSPTPIPATPTPTEEFYVEDPEIDIKTLDDAASTL